MLILIFRVELSLCLGLHCNGSFTHFLFPRRRDQTRKLKTGGQDTAYQNNANCNEHRGALKLCVTL